MAWILNAKTHLEVNPSAKVLVVDEAASVGGVWAKEHLYPGLKTNNMLGTYKFSAFPMTEQRFGVKPGQHIPGQVVHQHLHQYVVEFHLLPVICFAFKVQTAAMKETSQRELTINSSVVDDNSLTEDRVLADKLILATGLTSDPFMPKFEGGAESGAPLFHVKDFRKQANLKEDMKSIVVLGTTKSAWDVCYVYTTAGIQVHWIIKNSGAGLAWVAPLYMTPFKIWLEALTLARLLT